MRRRTEPLLEDLPDTGSLRGDLLALVQRMFDEHGGRRRRADVRPRRGGPGRRRSSAASWRPTPHEQKLRSVASIVSRAQARGELRPAPIPGLLLQVAPGVALFHQMSGEPLDADFAEHLVDRILIPLLRP